MIEVEPENNEPKEIEHTVNLSPKRGSEQFLDVSRTVLRIKRTGLDARELRKLHLEPEVVEVQTDETEDDKAEDEHVLTLPGHSFFLVGYRIAVVTTCCTVLDGQIQTIAEMHQYEERNTERTDNCVPVSAEKTADGVVSFLAEHQRKVHAAVEKQEENQRCSTKRHDELTANRRIF